MSEYRLSPSQINMYRRCSAQWMFRYIEGRKVPPSIHLATGTGADKGLEHNFKIKKVEGKDAPLDDILDIAETAFEKKFEEISEKEKREVSKGLEKDGMIQGIKVYRNRHARLIKPEDIEATQPKMDLQVLPNVNVIGYADLETKQKIIDFKLVGKKPSAEPRPDYWLQQNLYQEYWKKPEEPELHYMIKPTKTLEARVEKQAVSTDPKLTAAMVKPVIQGIQHEIFAPNREHNLCSRKWCGYWDICEKRFGGKVKS